MVRVRLSALALAPLATIAVTAGGAGAQPALGPPGVPAAPDVATYAIVVGSNAGGPGQIALRYAEDDARRVGRFLTELGGHAPGTVDVVVHPTPDQLRQHLERLSARVHADLTAGKKTRVFFYYSGHARATALDLGDAQLPLAELRTRLFSVPATLTVVVLDACQSGAFSRVKGATPAADFSFNSRSQLDASGIAVLASSSGSELSQESEQLRSSYFTHHLLVGMRGAGDTNRDGQVTIDEAYRYAYHQTLLATAETAVGGQHVSLEVDLKGHGEVPVSFPRAATSSIELPGPLEGRTLVHDKRARAVVAETYKARGAPVRIAVAPGEYEVLVRRDRTLARCQLTAGPGGATLDLGRCTTESIVDATRKGGGFERPMKIEVFGVLGPERRDAYTDTLQAFGYEEELVGLSAGLGVMATRRIDRRVWVGGAASFVQAPEWRRSDTDTDLSIGWNTTTVMAVARGVQPFAETGLLSRLGVYGHLGAGLAIARTRFDGADDMITRETFFGPALSAGAGLHVGWPGVSSRVPSFAMPMSATLGYELSYAPSIDNEIGDTHASGGHRFTLGLAWNF